MTISHCDSAERAQAILRRDFLDAPVRYFGGGLIRTLARDWTEAPPRDIALLMARANGAYAGFVLAHARGRAFWRSVAREHPRHAVAFLTALARTRFASPGHGQRHVSGHAVDVPALDAPFQWSDGARIGVVEFIYVQSDFRGQGIASALLRGAEQQTQLAGAPFIEAHIDAGNYSSVRAFRAAGWDVFRMATNDYWARKELAMSTEMPRR